MASNHAAERFRFGEFELDVNAYELRRGDQPVRLERQPMELLILLVQRRRALVTRAEIIERLWGGGVFVDAETGINTAVRKIRAALGDSATAPTFVERVPGKGYRFIAPVELPLPTAAPGNAVARPYVKRHLVGAALAATLIIVLTLVWVRRPDPADDPQPHVLPLTRLSGTEDWAAWSPDGRQVAFAWDGEHQDNVDIYLTIVGSSEVRRLTIHPGADLAPAWSPDGLRIAYTHVASAAAPHQIRVLSPLGSADHAVTGFHATFRPAWSPDGRYLAVARTATPPHDTLSAGIHLVSLAGQGTRRITEAAPSEIDVLPAFSPDGRRLAYGSCREATYMGNCHVKVVELHETYAAIGRPRQVTPQLRRLRGIAWSRDGTFIVYSGGWINFRRLWRVDADGSSPPRPIEEAGFDSTFPAVTGTRLLFSRRVTNTDIYSYDLRAGGAPRPVARSTGIDTHPALSPDGQRIAFCSDRSGDAMEIWVADRDGGNPRRLTRGPGHEQCSPAWSPDGARIAFDSTGDDGRYDIWTIDAAGGAPQQVTDAPGDENIPTWSSDGRWIYYSRDDGTATNIWRTLLETGKPEQITQDGSGLVAFDTSDGQSLVYLGTTSHSPVVLVPLPGGPRQTIVPCVMAISPGSAGFYYLPCRDETMAADGEHAVHFHDLPAGQDRDLGSFETSREVASSIVPPRSARTFAMSPDGSTIFYVQPVVAGADLMLIENFR